MTLKMLRKAAGMLIISATMVSYAQAQERNDVIQAYNEGAKLVQTDPAASIAAFEKSIVLAEKVGDPAADLKKKAEGVLPGLYLKVAANAINEKKPAGEIMSSARRAVAVSEKYGTPANKDNASKMLVQAYNSVATAYFTENDYTNALLTFDSLLAINPDYLNAIYNKALIYIKQSNSASFETTIDLFIQKVKAANDEAKVKQASTLALEYFRAAGSKANQSEKLDEALALLDKAAKYGDDKDLFYYYADVCNKMKNFDKGAEYAQKGLAMETGTADAKAKFFFQLGLAQEGKGQTTEACAAFKNAVYGPFTEASKAKLKNLKCI